MSLWFWRIVLRLDESRHIAGELANAGEGLELTGATCTVTAGRLPPDPKVHRVLALAVREATTNILRHTSASTVTLDLFSDASGSTLRVVNNGLNSSSVTPTSANLGSGITGIRDRVQPFGGTLITALDNAAGSFTFTLWVPNDLEGRL